jgi:hypothetical protein
MELRVKSERETINSHKFSWGISRKALLLKKERRIMLNPTQSKVKFLYKAKLSL